MSDYLIGLEGMPKLLDDENSLKQFNRKNYTPSFKAMYMKNLSTFAAIENVYNSVTDKEQMLTNMADALIGHAVELVKGSKKKSIQIDLNMVMVVYVLPMILEYQGNSSRPLADLILKGWNETFPKTNIQAASFEDIEKGFHRKFCYITTAVCESFGKDDHCYELEVLRDYRDHYLASLPDGADMINAYYDVAPSIVKHINNKPDSHEIYESIWEQYLAPCIAMIEKKQYEACKDHYRTMVNNLKEEYFYCS